MIYTVSDIAKVHELPFVNINVNTKFIKIPHTAEDLPSHIFTLFAIAIFIEK